MTLTVAKDNLTLCLGSTAVTVPVFISDRIEYLGGREVVDEETELSSLICKHNDIMDREEKLELKSLENQSASMFCLGLN